MKHHSNVDCCLRHAWIIKTHLQYAMNTFTKEHYFFINRAVKLYCLVCGKEVFLNHHSCIKWMSACGIELLPKITHKVHNYAIYLCIALCNIKKKKSFALA